MTVTIRPVTANIGAVVEGIDLAGPPSRLDLATVREAVLEHHVVFLREQSTDPGVLVDFGKHWAEISTDHPAYLMAHDTHPEIAVVSNAEGGLTAADAWHADVTWADPPPLGSILQLVEVPEFGGDTMWRDMSAAYDSLSDTLQEFLGTLNAVHRAGDYEAEHPVVRTIPETGRKTLFVNPVFTSHVRGLRPAESEMLLSYLYQHTEQPEFEVRWRWSPGDLAFWDNRCTWHYALGDHGTERRVAHRLALMGDQFATV